MWSKRYREVTLNESTVLLVDLNEAQDRANRDAQVTEVGLAPCLTRTLYGAYRFWLLPH